MITGHFTVALGTLGVLALLGTNPAAWTAKLEAKDGSAISGTARVETTTGPATPMPMPDTARRDTLNPLTPDPAASAAAPTPGGPPIKVTLTVNGAPKSASLAWHLHQGKCGSNGSLIGDSNAYTPVTVDPNGNGNASTTLSGALTEKGEYYVDIHASADQGGAVAACGNLEYQKPRAD